MSFWRPHAFASHARNRDSCVGHVSEACSLQNTLAGGLKSKMAAALLVKMALPGVFVLEAVAAAAKPDTVRRLGSTSQTSASVDPWK